MKGVEIFVFYLEKKRSWNHYGRLCQTMNQPRDSKGRFVKRTGRLRGGSAFYNPFENQMKGRGKGKSIRGGDFFNRSGPQGPVFNGTPLYTSGYSSNLDSLKKAFQGAYDNRDLIKYAAALIATGPAGVAYLASTDKGSQFLANQVGLGMRRKVRRVKKPKRKV